MHTESEHHMPAFIQRFLPSLLFACMTWTVGAALLFTTPSHAVEQSVGDVGVEVPLIVGNRTIYTFRSSLGMFSAAERADAARKRVEQAFESPGDGWTSVKSTPEGVVVELDGNPLFFVVPGDARASLGETPEALANQASRVLQKAWGEARERRTPGLNLNASLRVLAATVLLVLLLTLIFKGTKKLENRIMASLSDRLSALPTKPLGYRAASLIRLAFRRFSVLLAWLLALSVLFVYLTYGLSQFVFTRPAGENLSRSIAQLLLLALHGITDSLPGIFISALIFLVAWAVTRISTEIFAQLSNAPASEGMLNAHTALATRRIVNASVWLFAVAMAYPYLPGSHTEAFKGLSVLIGLMVSIGASGVVGQIASGLILIYTRALLVGEYVRIQDTEGTVTELGLFVTRLRTGLGEEISLPNALVLANVSRNYSRAAVDAAFMLDVVVTIGYDTPWRQVHAMLLEAARRIPELLKTPAPFVVQTALSDFYVEYKLVVYADSKQPKSRAHISSQLNAEIQDEFNRNAVQIMSPHYLGDPESAKLVPQSKWHIGTVKDTHS
jgi:small-conductance mechanosensitive channel